MFKLGADYRSTIMLGEVMEGSHKRGWDVVVILRPAEGDEPATLVEPEGVDAEAFATLCEESLFRAGEIAVGLGLDKG